jgi:hypothetical protein
VLDQELHQGVYRTGFSINDIPNMASGIYFLRVTGEKYSKAIKMVHTKTGVETHVNLNLEQIANTASTKFVPMRKMSYEDLAVLDSMQVKGNDIVDTTVVPQVNNGQIADINVTPAVHITGMTEGVDSDSGAANMPLADADVWIGTRDKNAQGNFKTKTNADGSYDLKVPKGQPGTFHQDTLFVEAQGYNQRSKLTNRYSNQEENTQSITDKVIIDLFNRLYLNGGLCKPDTNVITFYVKPNAQYNVPDIMWNKYIDRAIAKLESTTGGIYRGERTTDSAKAYNITEFMILQHNGDTWMADIGFYRLPEDWTTIIGSNTRFNPVTNPMFEPDIALSSDKEELNIFGKGDINESDVPASWKESIQYVANDRILKTEYPKIDIDMDRVAAKLPRGYAANTTYVPK